VLIVLCCCLFPLCCVNFTVIILLCCSLFCLYFDNFIVLWLDSNVLCKFLCCCLFSLCCVNFTVIILLCWCLFLLCCGLFPLFCGDFVMLRHVSVVWWRVCWVVEMSLCCALLGHRSLPREYPLINHVSNAETFLQNYCSWESTTHHRCIRWILNCIKLARWTLTSMWRECANCAERISRWRKSSNIRV